jgi:hypothetical protein
MSVRNAHLSQPLDARLRGHDVIPAKACPERSRRAGIQFEGWRSSCRTRDLPYKQ